MKENSELFELCKQVYADTGWDDLADDHEWFTERGVIGYKRNGVAPLYTSDYLLEKLPKEFAEYDVYHEQDVYYRLTLGMASNGWLANYTYENVAIHHIFGDTPLKALLKLTLKLHDEGLLK